MNALIDPVDDPEAEHTPKPSVYKAKAFEVYPWTMQYGMIAVECSSWDTAMYLANLYWLNATLRTQD